MLKEGNIRIPSGCAISGIIDQTGAVFTGQTIADSIATMHDRSNGLGGGFAAYGIYPEFKDHYAFHMFYDGLKAKQETEDLLKANFVVAFEEKIPTRKTQGINNAPLIYRYFALPKFEKLNALELSDDDFTVKFIFDVNKNINGAYIFSSGKNMGVFKAVGYPEDVAEFYKLETYSGYMWTAHGRFPTNTPGWWGGAHPFNLLNISVVHNGELSSYDTNRKYLEEFGYVCTLQTDTEVAAYIFDLLLRKHNLPVNLAAKVVASPLWKQIDRMSSKERALYNSLKMIYSKALLNGPFSIIATYEGGFIAINDRIKLRPLTAAKKGDMIYVASEESAIREVCKSPDKIWIPRGGEPVIAELEQQNALELYEQKEVTA
ncbi:glutamine amidotransferase family protein [Thermoanaerobacterium sp. RBIITD]|uniref:class II glutamine amidotransferase n=1 Tax=Thermoanaerobacterium sp. RBIITD TaxID=1550240 RepID=UPI000BB7E993|nr:glutamine amidotransferase family protein [Thermoanaerobacterium sp. RBIITD]SNX54605.1 Glutamate synthase domain-containing protein 1 [Thermoanaerobacterium sp. RBIITD]